MNEVRGPLSDEEVSLISYRIREGVDQQVSLDLNAALIAALARAENAEQTCENAKAILDMMQAKVEKAENRSLELELRIDGLSKTGHDLSVWDQTIGCDACQHVDWMEDTLPETCPKHPLSALLAEANARAEKAEAERDEWKDNERVSHELFEASCKDNEVLTRKLAESEAYALGLRQFIRELYVDLPSYGTMVNGRCLRATIGEVLAKPISEWSK
jgi:hypothetical protein